MNYSSIYSIGAQVCVCYACQLLRRIKTLLPAIFLLFAGCGSESKTAISKYTGDGDISYLSSPSLLFGIDGIVINLGNLDLSKDGVFKYSLQDLPLGDPYIIFYVVPDMPHLDEVLKNNYHLRVYNNGIMTNEINLPFEKMINNKGAGLNRFYALKGVNGLDVSSMLNVNSGDNYSIEMIYINTHVKNPSYGYLLVERGGFK